MRFSAAALRSMSLIVSLAALSACSETSRPPVSPLQPRPPQAAPTITQVLPSIGSAAGGATVKIVGTGFVTGTVVTFDGIKITGRSDSPANSYTIFNAEAPAHAAGAVDVLVTNPDGQSHRLEAGYTYAPQASFDLNGRWAGYTSNGTDTGVEFEISDNRLVSATCAYTAYMPFVFSEQPTVHNGEFQLTAEGGATLAGRVVSHTEIVGTINFPQCNPSPLTWRVYR